MRRPPPDNTSLNDSAAQATADACQYQSLINDLIPAQHTKIKDIQQQINEIQTELYRLLSTPDPQADRIIALKDKIVSLEWSLNDQKERLERYGRALKILDPDCDSFNL